jgi:hypothetical protein
MQWGPSIGCTSCRIHPLDKQRRGLYVSSAVLAASCHSVDSTLVTPVTSTTFSRRMRTASTCPPNDAPCREVVHPCAGTWHRYRTLGRCLERPHLAEDPSFQTSNATNRVVVSVSCSGRNRMACAYRGIGTDVFDRLICTHATGTYVWETKKESHREDGKTGKYGLCEWERLWNKPSETWSAHQCLTTHQNDSFSFSMASASRECTQNRRKRFQWLHDWAIVFSGFVNARACTLSTAIMDSTESQVRTCWAIGW